MTLLSNVGNNELSTSEQNQHGIETGNKLDLSDIK